MSVLQKMSIQGIRSFGPDDSGKQMIKFTGPLTLILGQNGTGKTTIIECLKYITTGDPPPNTGSGAYFVLDPKVANQSEVLAQVKLKFFDSAGKETLITRSCKTVQKQVKGKPSFSSIEAYIRRRSDDGKYYDLNAKCSSINDEMINLLGVSKPVLTNVIFCHQEDANWPLSEGKALKTKFDEIFSATRYAKALNKLQEERKILVSQVKVDSTHIEYLKGNKTRCENKQKELSKMKVRLATSEDDLKGIGEKLKPIQDRLNELRTVEESYFQAKYEKDQKKARVAEMEESVRSLRKGIKNVYPGSIKELKRELKTFSHKEEEDKEELQSQLDGYNLLQKRHQEKYKEKSALLVAIGELDSDHKRHLNRISSRHLQISKLCNEYEISEFQTDLSSSGQVNEDDVLIVMNLIQQFINGTNQEIEKKVQNLENKIKEAQVKVDQLKDHKSRLEQKETSNKELTNSNKAEIERLTLEMEQIDSSHAFLEQIDDELESAEATLNRNSKSLDISSVQKEISESETTVNEQTVKLDKIRKESSQARLFTEIRTKLDHLKKDKIAKQNHIDRLFSKHEEKLSELLGCVPKANVKSQISGFINQKLNEVTSQRSKLNGLKIKLSRLETNRSALQDRRSQIKREVDGSKDKIFNVCGTQSFAIVLKALEQSIDALQKEKGALTGSQFLYKKFIEKLEKSSPSACPLCHREFDDPADVGELVTELKDKVNSVPSRIREKSTKLTSEQKRYEDVLQVKPIEDSCKKWTDEDIPDLENKVKKIESEIEELRQMVSENEFNLSILVEQEMAGRSICDDMGVLDQYQIEVQKLDKQIHSNSSMIPADSPRTLQELENIQKQIESQLNSLRQRIQSKKDEVNQYEKSMLECRDKITKLKEERQVISETLNKRTSLENAKNKLNASNKDLIFQIQDVRNQLEPMKINLRIVEKEKAQKVEEKELFRKEKYNELQVLKNKFKDLLQVDNDIKGYIENGREQALEDKRAALDTLKKVMHALKEEDDKLKESIDLLKQSINQQEINHRNLKDNLQMMEKKTDIENLNREIEESKEGFAEMDMESLGREKQKLAKSNNDLVNESQVARGRQSELKESIRKLEAELMQPDLKEADSKYKIKMIELRTNEVAAEDLVKYHDALDRALNQYHRIKMSEVNKIIRELWQITYKGNDIDYIEIDCGEEPGNKGMRRNVYNYRVVLVKSNVSLDMRGRCSAGQKVLASLIIRLALAETFCLQCGILTLDEPTTNLDRANIDSLAESLKNIVEMRQKQKNFQLIIITHDEEFIELLGRGQFVEDYYKITKNDQGFSRIMKCSMD